MKNDQNIMNTLHNKNKSNKTWKCQKRHGNRGFHKLDEIGNNANIGIRGFTT